MLIQFEKLKNSYLLYILALFIVFMSFISVCPAQDYYGDLGENYYTFYGGPDLSAQILGSGEVPRGETTSIQVSLSNMGVIEGFKSEKEIKRVETVGDKLKVQLQKMQVDNVNMITTAVGIRAELLSSDPNIRIKTGPQEAGSLPAGSTSPLPLKYTIEVGKDAPAGDHNLILKVSYKHLKNVIYSADSIDDGEHLLGIRNLDAAYWYSDVVREIPLILKVENDTKFEITSVESDMVSKKEQIIYVTYKNIGDITAKDATVRISTSTPFSTTDDQSFIGSLPSGDSGTAKFKLSIDSDSVIYDKLYSVNSEILYEDQYGNQKISDTLKIETSVSKKSSAFPLIAAGILIVILAVGGIIYLKKKKESQNQKSS